MTSPAGGLRQPDVDPEALDPISAARRYPRPALGTPAIGGANLPTVEELNTFARRLGPPSWWTLPRALALIGICAAPFLSPLGLILGLVAHYKARQRGESTKLPIAAWALSMGLTVVATLFNIWMRTLFNTEVF